MILQKIDQNCSNVRLIDENMCFGDALSIINTNIQTLSSNLYHLSQESSSLDSLFTLVSENSAAILTTIANVKLINSVYESPYTTVMELSSNWVQPISIFYPQIVDIAGWYAGINPNVQSNTLKNWLDINFKNTEFPQKQVIYVFVSMYQNTPFVLQFSRTYFEDCRPNNGGGATATCHGCPSYRYAHCNISGLGCTNAYSYCGGPQNSTTQESYGCIGYNGKTLQVEHHESANDTFTTRVKSYKFINQGGWVFVPPTP